MQRYITYCAALVQRNSRKINSFEDVFKGNSLAGTILEEYYLQSKMQRVFSATTSQAAGSFCYCCFSKSILVCCCGVFFVVEELIISLPLCSLNVMNTYGPSPRFRTLQGLTHLAAGRLLQALLCFVHKVLLFEVQVAFEFDQSLKHQKKTHFRSNPGNRCVW